MQEPRDGWNHITPDRGFDVENAGGGEVLIRGVFPRSLGPAVQVSAEVLRRRIEQGHGPVLVGTRRRRNYPFLVRDARPGDKQARAFNGRVTFLWIQEWRVRGWSVFYPTERLLRLLAREMR